MKRNNDRRDIVIVTTNDIDLAIVTRGEQFYGRFLFTPSHLNVGDRVWLRIERHAAGYADPAVDVTAVVTHLMSGDRTVTTARVVAGLRVRGTLEQARPAPDDNKRTIYGGFAWDPLSQEWDAAEEPTEREAYTDVFRSPFADTTIRDVTRETLFSMDEVRR